MTTPPTSPADTAAQALPLFYREPQLISAVTHSDWRIKSGDIRFAEEAIAVPIVVGEFAASLRNFPILFTGGPGEISPIVLLGLDATNLFVSDGQWAQDAYVPAYVRRYPFGFISLDDGFALGIDAASERIVRNGEEGAALFENGEPTEVTKQALQFCNAYRAESTATGAFCDALQSKGLLMDRRVDATLPNGLKFGVDGFRVVDTRKFAALDAATIVEWHHKGWLALVHFHIASIDRFETLLARRSAKKETLSS